MPRVPEIFSTARLTLRRPQSSDASAMFRAYASRPEVTRYLSWPTHRSVDATLAFVRFSDDAWQRDGAGPWLVFATASGALLGSTGLEAGADGTATTGYLLVPEAWGQGYATELLLGVIDEARAGGFTRLSALVNPENRASIRVLEKAGLTRAPDRGQTHPFPNLDAARPLPVFGYELALSPVDSERAPRFATLEAAMSAIEDRSSAGLHDWSLTHTSLSRDGSRLLLHGTLPQAMHFGAVRVSLETGEVTLTDEEHRDGGDQELVKATLPEAWAARVRALASKG